MHELLTHRAGFRLAVASLVSLLSFCVHAQVSCQATGYALNVFVPGGGFQVSTGPDVDMTVRPGSRVGMGVYCEGSGQFPPPTIQGATYSWTTGDAQQRIEVLGPPPGGSATYRVTIAAPNGTQVRGVTLHGAAIGTPICDLGTPWAQPIAPDTTLAVRADCAPPATAISWHVAFWLGNITLFEGFTESGIRIMNTQPGDVMPVYIVPSNGAGTGPPASLLLTAGNPPGQLPVNAARLASGGNHTCALNTGGGAKCWGSDSGGQLGDYGGGSVVFSTAPQNVIASANVVALTAGAEHSCALLANGTVRCWGENSYGQLGDGTTTHFGLPVNVPGISGIASLSTGPASRHTCAVFRNGDLTCWGRNDRGQLGNPSLPPTFSAVPQDVPSLYGQTLAVAAGSAHTCAVTTSRTVKCWGRNSEGQLGNGTTVDSAVPVAVPGVADVREIVAGASHSCALLAGGLVKCWGRNGDGELGNGSSTSFSATPVDVAGLDAATQLSAGGQHTCAVRSGGSAWCWGRNSEGELGDVTLASRKVPVLVTSTASTVSQVSAGGFHTCAMISGGGVECWGFNASGQVGDGTAAHRTTPQLVVGVRGEGFLDLTLEDGFSPPPQKLPVFRALTSATATNDVSTSIQFRPQDIGTTGSVYVFALAPANRVVGANLEKAQVGRIARGSPKDAPVQCVLAQLNGSGQLRAVSPSNLQAYVTGVLSGQGQSVAVLNGTATANIDGTTFYVGYGSDPSSMFASGVNRSVASVGNPGSITCQPQPPQTGWWWNTGEGGRGYSIEASGSHLFFAAYLYDLSGRATWTISAGNTSLDGSLFTGRLESYSGGQTLFGAYRPPGPVSYIGDITLAFNDASHGTMVWPGGTVAIERFDIVPSGSTLAPQANQPESGWWWNPSEGGRGYFLEWQGGELFMAGYMYDEAGNPLWYLSSNTTPSTNLQSYSNSWWQYANGQTMTGSYRAPTQVSNNVAPVTIQFQGAETGIMTLPGGRTTTIRRYRF